MYACFRSKVTVCSESQAYDAIAGCFCKCLRGYIYISATSEPSTFYIHNIYRTKLSVAKARRDNARQFRSYSRCIQNQLVETNSNVVHDNNLHNTNNRL